MTSLPARSRRTTTSACSAAGVLLLIAGTLTFLLPGSAAAAATAVSLGTAGSFGVLAGAGITNTGPTTVNGDIGTFPTTSISGTATLTVNGTNHGGDAVTQGAKNDLVAAYDDAAGQGPKNAITGDLGGQMLVAGVYSSPSSIGLTGTLSLNAAGNPDAVFVFQAGSSLTTASGSRVLLVNGAQACNVFWQIGSSATIGTGTSFVGTILALTDITVTTNATIAGRVLARNGAVTLDTNTVSRPACAAPAATATPTASPSASASTSTTATPSATTTAAATATATASATATVAATTASATPTSGAPAATPAATRTPAAAPAPAPGPEAPELGVTPRGAAAAPGLSGETGSGTGQVTAVPSGGVAAGDGSTASSTRSHRGATTAAAVGFLAFSVAVVRRRRPA